MSMPFRTCCPNWKNCGETHVSWSCATCDEPLKINKDGNLICQLCMKFRFVGETRLTCQAKKIWVTWESQAFLLTELAMMVMLPLATGSPCNVDFFFGQTLIDNTKKNWSSYKPISFEPAASKTNLKSHAQLEMIFPLETCCPNVKFCGEKHKTSWICTPCKIPLKLTENGNIFCEHCKKSKFIQQQSFTCKAKKTSVNWQSPDLLVSELSMVGSDKWFISLSSLQTLIHSIRSKWQHTVTSKRNSYVTTNLILLGA